MSAPKRERKETGWFDSPGNVDKLWRGLLAACAALFVVGIFAKSGAHVWIEKIPGALELLAFVGFMVVVRAAKALRPLVSRDEDYYDRD